MNLIKVMPWSKDQGEFVIIEEQDFDPAVHKRYEEKKKPGPKPKQETQE